MTVLRSLTARSRFHDVRFCYFPLDAADPTQREYLFVACEDGNTRVFDLTTPVPAVDAAEGETGPSMDAVAMLTGHSNRFVPLPSTSLYFHSPNQFVIVSNRVKMIDLLEVAYPSLPTPTSASSTLVLSSISSDGKINLYDLAALSTIVSSPNADGTPVEIAPSASHDTDGSRLTCLCVIGLAFGGAKPEADGDDEEEEDSEDGDEEESGSEEEELESEEEGEAEDEEDAEEEFEEE